MGEWLNIAEFFLTARVREGRGERIALRLSEGDVTYVEVERRASRAARGLAALGVRQEERVIVALPDSADFVTTLFGILKLGAVVVMVNPGLEPTALAAVLELARPAAVVVDPAAAPRMEEAVERVSADGHPRPPIALPASLDRSRGGAEGGLEAARTHRDDPAIWLFSGGTTGRPKAAVQRHASFVNTTERYASATMGYRPDDVTLSVPKLYFGYATGSNLLFPFAVGASAALFPEHPTPEVLFSRIARHRPTVLVNVPKMVAEMVDHPGAPQADLSSLRLATSAGEALPPSLHARWVETFGVPLYDGLGTAEMWHVFLTNRPGDVRPGTLGRPVAGFDVAVRDDEGAELPDGQVGRLWVRGGSLANGYFRDALRSAEAFRGEWFVGGDMVWRDGEGYFHYSGRSDDALKVGGKWLLPAEVEDCLLTHARVAEVAVVGVADARGLVKPVAFVVPTGPGAGTPEEAATLGAGLEDELRLHCLARLEPYKRPRQVLTLAELPRTHLGKVDRGALRRLAEGTPAP